MIYRDHYRFDQQNLDKNLRSKLNSSDNGVYSGFQARNTELKEQLFMNNVSGKEVKI